MGGMQGQGMGMQGQGMGMQGQGMGMQGQGIGMQGQGMGMQGQGMGMQGQGMGMQGGMRPGMPQQGMGGFSQQQVRRSCHRIVMISLYVTHLSHVESHALIFFRRVSATPVDFNSAACSTPPCPSPATPTLLHIASSLSHNFFPPE
jgi:hypothetical protein